MPAGMVVPQNFIFYYHPDPDSNAITLSSMPVPVTNRQNEFDINEDKASIQTLDPKYVYDYEREFNNYARVLSDSQSASYISMSKTHKSTRSS